MPYRKSLPGSLPVLALLGSAVLACHALQAGAQEVPTGDEIVRLLQQESIEDRGRAERALVLQGPPLLKVLDALSVGGSSIEVREAALRIGREIVRIKRVRSLRFRGLPTRLPEREAPFSEILLDFLSPLGLSRVSVHDSLKDVRLLPGSKDRHPWSALDGLCKAGNLVVVEDATTMMRRHVPVLPRPQTLPTLARSELTEYSFSARQGWARRRGALMSCCVLLRVRWLRPSRSSISHCSIRMAN